MIEVALQYRDNAFYPYSQEDLEASKEFRDNQIVRAKIQGVKKERSYKQLKMFHGVLRTVAENARHPNWNNLPKAKFSLKVALNYVNEGVVAVDRQGTVHFSYRSFGYADLPHMEACNVFDRSWPILAKVLGITEKKLLENADK